MNPRKNEYILYCSENSFMASMSYYCFADGFSLTEKHDWEKCSSDFRYNSTQIAHLCRANVGPTDNPSEGVVGPTSFWPVEATLAYRWLDVGPTVAKVDGDPTLAHWWQDFVGPTPHHATGEPTSRQRCVHQPKWRWANHWFRRGANSRVLSGIM